MDYSKTEISLLEYNILVFLLKLEITLLLFSIRLEIYLFLLKLRIVEHNFK